MLDFAAGFFGRLVDQSGKLGRAMTLHEAIVEVLSTANRAMTASAIADEINQRKLYSRRDGFPVLANQISARVNNYARLFARGDGLIDLQR